MILAFVALAGIAQTKPVIQQSKAEKQYIVQLNETELQQLFALIAMAKNLAPYGKQKADKKVQTIQFIDAYSERLAGKIKALSVDTAKHK